MRKSFTLIELINVIIIIGIMAVLIIPRFMNMRDEARAARDEAVLAALRSAVYIYYITSAINGTPSYPPDLDALRALVKWDPPELAYEYEWEYDPDSGMVGP